MVDPIPCGSKCPGVRVFEKDEEGIGKDIRVWTVQRGAGDVYTAEHFGHVPHPAVPSD